MYLPNAHYIPAPFKQSLTKTTVTQAQSPRPAPKTEPKPEPEPADIHANSQNTSQAPKKEAESKALNDKAPQDIAAASAAPQQGQNDSIETALLVMLLMDAIH